MHVEVCKTVYNVMLRHLNTRKIVSFHTDSLFQVTLSGGEGHEIVTEEIEAQQVVHEEALPWEVSNAWRSYCITSSGNGQETARGDRGPAGRS
jgi:hypothetical protein